MPVVYSINYCSQLLIPQQGKKKKPFFIFLAKENYFKMSLLVALSVETSYGTESHLFLKTKLSGKTSKTHLRKAYALAAFFFFFLIQRIKAVGSQ